MKQSNFCDFLREILAMSTRDKDRLLQCMRCEKDPSMCGCTEKDEDKSGMCLKYRERGKNG